jgi:hypothetical protein
MDDPKIQEAKDQMKIVYKRGINIYAYYNKVKNKMKRVDHIPPAVIIEVCKYYICQLEAGKVEKNYPYFEKVLIMKSHEWHANNQQREHAKYKKQAPMAQSVKDILGGMFK